MKIKEIPFKGRIIPAGTSKQRMNNLGWAGPIAFPIPIRFNDTLCTHFLISSYGAIRLPQASNPRGKWHYLSDDKILPSGLDSSKQGWMVVPWGEYQRVTGCGTEVYVYSEGGVNIIDFTTKAAYGDKEKFQFRVEFPVREHNVVRFYYYHCVSRYDTYVGAVLSPEDYIDWPIKENRPYMKKGLELLCVKEAIEAVEPEVIEPEVEHNTPPTNTPFGTHKEWKTVYDGHGYRVQEYK